jgi:adenylate cyclase
MSDSHVDAFRFRRATKVIAVADVVESVRLMEQDEQDFIRRWCEFVSFVVGCVAAESARLHRSLGDGLMLEFADAQSCVRTAMAMHTWLRERNRNLPADRRLHLRIGAHIADFLADEHDIYGNDVNLAARIASLAGPGELVISAALRRHLGRGLPVPLEDLGSCHLKHVKEPVHAFRIGEAGIAPVMPSSNMETHAFRGTVAVLAFGTEGTETRVGAGVSGVSLADELVAALVRSDALQVVSRMSALPDPTQGSLHKVQTHTAARYVLTGRARMHDGNMALFAELADAASGLVVWAESFASTSGPAGLLDPRLLARVAAAVHASVIQHEIEAAHARPLPALDGPGLLLASVGLMHRLSPVDMENARGMLEHLLERWRRHATAHAWLAHLHVLRVQQAGPGVGAHDHALARAHAAAAVQSDPASPLVLAVDGHTCLHGARNMEAAAERFHQALSLRENHSITLLFQAEMMALRGSARVARITAARASQWLSLEPLHYLYDAVEALAALADGDAEAAATLAQQSLRRNPRYLPAWHTLVVAQVESERLGEAHATQQQLLKRQPSFSVSGFLKATPMGDALAARFAEGLLQAGAPS